MIRVVSGLLFASADRNNVLLGLRKADKLRPSMWETPGGKVDPGEDPEGALVREWREELGVAIAVRAVVGEVAFVVEAPVYFTLYEVRLQSAVNPQPLDHQVIGWFDIEHAILRMPCTPSTYLLYPAIKAYASRR